MRASSTPAACAANRRAAAITLLSPSRIWEPIEVVPKRRGLARRAANELPAAKRHRYVDALGPLNLRRPGAQTDERACRILRSPPWRWCPTPKEVPTAVTGDIAAQLNGPPPPPKRMSINRMPLNLRSWRNWCTDRRRQPSPARSPKISAELLSRVFPAGRSWPTASGHVATPSGVNGRSCASLLAAHPAEGGGASEAVKTAAGFLRGPADENANRRPRRIPSSRNRILAEKLKVSATNLRTTTANPRSSWPSVSNDLGGVEIIHAWSIGALVSKVR